MLRIAHAHTSTRRPGLGRGHRDQSGPPVRKPVRFWAYMWATDEDTGDDHWHQHVPTEHAA